MTCDEARGAFSDLFDDALSGAPRAALNQHLEGCAACQAEWAAFQRTMRAVAALGGAEPSPGFAARVRQQVEAPAWWQRIAQWLFFPLGVKVPIQAAALVLLAFAGVLLYQRSPELRREAEFQPALPPPVVREAPSETAPPASPPIPRPQDPIGQFDKAPRTERESSLRTDSLKAGRAESRAAPSDAAPSVPQARLEPMRERAPSPAAEEAGKKEVGKILLPPEGPKAAEPPGESRTRAPEPGVAARRLMQSAPPAPGQPHAPIGATQPSPVPPLPVDELYSVAVADLSRQSYDRAIAGFRAFIAQHPHDARVADARLQLADAYAAQHRYAEAIPEYQALTRQFPDSPLVPTALYREGQARLVFGDQGGCQVLREMLEHYPQAREAASAREVLSARCP